MLSTRIQIPFTAESMMGIATGVIFIMLANFQLVASVGAQGGLTNCIGCMCIPGMDMVIHLGEHFPPFYNTSIEMRVFGF